MKNIPQRIYLQVEGESLNDDFEELRGVTWCVDRVHEGDIEYELKEE